MAHAAGNRRRIANQQRGGSQRAAREFFFSPSIQQYDRPVCCRTMRDGRGPQSAGWRTVCRIPRLVPRYVPPASVTAGFRHAPHQHGAEAEAARPRQALVGRDMLGGCRLTQRRVVTHPKIRQRSFLFTCGALIPVRDDDGPRPEGQLRAVNIPAVRNFRNSPVACAPSSNCCRTPAATCAVETWGRASCRKRRMTVHACRTFLSPLCWCL